MKTYQEIKDKIAALAEDPADHFGWRRLALIELLPFEEAGDYLKPEATEDDWEAYDDAADAIKSYLDFAVGKAVDQRGISANRSIERITAWLWAHNDPDLSRRFHDAEYAPYGKGQLEVVAKQFRPDLLDELATVTEEQW